jgi:hypothetical protein
MGNDEFDNILAQGVNLPQRRGHVPYWALKWRVDLADEYIEDVKAEFMQAQYMAVKEAAESSSGLVMQPQKDRM